MSSYPETRPPSIDANQYDLLWNVVCKGKILWVHHEEEQGDFIQGMLKLGYLDATPRLRTTEERVWCQARLDQCYDQLAAIPRSEWPARHKEAQDLFRTANSALRDLTGSDYDVSEAGRRLVLEWEHARAVERRAHE